MGINRHHRLLRIPRQISRFFRVGDTGFELSPPLSSEKDALAVEGNVKYNALCADSGVIDPDLEGLIRTRPNLSESVRKEILKHLPSPSTRHERQTEEG